MGNEQSGLSSRIVGAGELVADDSLQYDARCVPADLPWVFAFLACSTRAASSGAIGGQDIYKA